MIPWRFNFVVDLYVVSPEALATLSDAVFPTWRHIGSNKARFNAALDRLRRPCPASLEHTGSLNILAGYLSHNVSDTIDPPRYADLLRDLTEFHGGRWHLFPTVPSLVSHPAVRDADVSSAARDLPDGARVSESAVLRELRRLDHILSNLSPPDLLLTRSL